MKFRLNLYIRLILSEYSSQLKIFWIKIFFQTLRKQYTHITIHILYYLIIEEVNTTISVVTFILYVAMPGVDYVIIVLHMQQ